MKIDRNMLTYQCDCLPLDLRVKHFVLVPLSGHAQRFLFLGSKVQSLVLGHWRMEMVSMTLLGYWLLILMRHHLLTHIIVVDRLVNV